MPSRKQGNQIDTGEQSIAGLAAWTDINDLRIGVKPEWRLDKA